MPTGEGSHAPAGCVCGKLSRGQSLQSHTEKPVFEFKSGRREIHLFGRVIGLPASRVGRIVVGILLVVLGCLGFLPILGFWMVPLGILVLSVDIPWFRRWRRRMSVRFGRRRNTGQRES